MCWREKKVVESALKITSHTKNTTIGCERVRICVEHCVFICRVDRYDRDGIGYHCARVEYNESEIP